MSNFVHWRRMTWVIVVWSGGMLALLLVGVIRREDVAAGCVSDSAGVALNVVTKQNCLDAGGNVVLQGVLLAAFWLLGVAILSVIWFASRPLWRQGYGVRLRRLREVPRGDV
jgi:hypothetical protein